jgi:hypothetical protein
MESLGYKRNEMNVCVFIKMKQQGCAVHCVRTRR